MFTAKAGLNWLGLFCCGFKLPCNYGKHRVSLVRRVAIATYEAEMNLIVYTNGGEICVRVEPHEIFVNVEDSGPGILDIEKALQPGYNCPGVGQRAGLWSWYGPE